MEEISEPQKKTIQAHQNFHFFNPRKIIEKGKSPDLFFSSNLTIAPDEKSILIATEGKVYTTEVRPLFCNRTIDLIINHPSVKISTMIAAHKKDDRSLLVVSAGNYFESDTNKWISEIILYDTKTKTYSNNIQKWPIQAIKLSPNGKYLIAANLSTVILFEIVNLSLKLQDSLGLTPIHNSCHQQSYQKNTIVDIAINKDMIEKDFYIITAGKNGLTQLSKTTNNNTELSKTKQNIWNDIIRKIHFPKMDTIIYTTDTGEAKTIDLMGQLLKYDIKSQSSDFSDSPFTFSNAPPHYDQTSLDTGNEIASIYWTKNETASDRDRSKLYVYKMYNNKKVCLKLIADFSENTYEDISNKGQLEEHNTHFLTATLYNSTITALASNGEIFIWNLLSEKQSDNGNEENKTSDKEKEKEDYTKHHHVQRKSKIKTEDDNVKKSTSFITRAIQRTPRSSHSSTPNIPKRDLTIASPRNQRTPRHNTGEER